VLFVGGEKGVARRADCDAMSDVGQLNCVTFADLTSAYIESIDPDFIVSAMATSDFDMLDLCQLLHWAEFRGRYVVHCGDAPDTQLLRREIRDVAPDLDVELVTNAQLYCPD